VYNTLNIYKAYRQVKAQQNNKGIRLPKDWESYFKNNLNKPTQDNIQELTDMFNTRLCHINLYEYMAAGFDILKGFTYKHFMDDRVMDRYIHNDKMKKRYWSFDKPPGIIKSLLYIYGCTDSYTTSIDATLKQYCKKTNIHDAIHDAIHDYISNKITTSFMVWIIKDRYITPSELEWSMMPFISGNKKSIFNDINKNHEWLKKLKGMKYEEIQRKHVDR